LAPRTADDTDLKQWMELLFLSGTGELSLAVTRRKKNHRAMYRKDNPEIFPGCLFS
jgi:hypothetical protein